MAKPSRPSDPQNSKRQPRTFFLTTSAAGGRSVFQTDRMANLLIDVLRSNTLAGKFKVHDFVIMRNHVHVLLTVPGDVSVEKAMQLIKGGFSFRAKKELGFMGEIWQRGFSDVRITDEKSFRTHQEYIYNNPVRAGMVSQPEEYRHSSAYLRRLKRAGAKAHIKEASGGTTEVVP
ncbi:MAG: transposase [Terriglobales bacterium]